MLGGLGADFLRRVAFWSIRSWGLLRWFCVTGAALRMTRYHFFVAGRRSSLDRWGRKVAKRIGTRPSALHATFHFWRKSRRIASFLMLSTKKMRESRRIALFLMLSSAKIEEISLNCCVFDVVKCKNWGRLAELLRFWCCQVQKLRKSRRIASFSSLQIDRWIEERQLQLQLQVPLHYTTTTSTNILRYITQHWLHYATLFTSNLTTLHKLHHSCYNGNNNNNYYYYYFHQHHDHHHHHHCRRRYNYNYSYTTLHYNTLIKLLYITATKATTTATTLHYTTLRYTNIH